METSPLLCKYFKTTQVLNTIESRRRTKAKAGCKALRREDRKLKRNGEIDYIIVEIYVAALLDRQSVIDL